MEYITKPSITRVARRAGVKTMSEDCYTFIHDTIGQKIEEIMKVALVVNGARSTKTLMLDDIHYALSLKGYNVAKSTDIGTGTCK
jgi:histone H3/H4